ncbi:GAP family protein [Cellulomonas sp. 179-A 4D5 NHS]|uniref:GAP family protein n=1 Tax=Cellulomonas sp. 179-A 4D5 NHS TaxID=3142378 RepID=UPI0039A3514D
MGPAIGQSLPVAVGILLSPMPIVAVVLMLVTPRARTNSVAFVLAWLVGLFVAGAVVLLVVGAASGDAGPTPVWLSWVKIVLGLGAVLVAVRQFRGRPRPGVESPAPAWMAAIDAFTPVKAAGLGLLLSVVNPKNLLLLVSGAAAIAGATSDRGTQLAALAVFTVVATLGVAAPVVVYLATGPRAAHLLEEVRVWMVHNNAVIVAVLMLVIGAKLVGDGVSAL